MQLRRQFGAGAACSNDCDIELPRPHRLRLSVSPDAGVDKTLVEAYRLEKFIQRNRELLDARRSEILAGAANRHHQRVVLERSRRGDLVAFLVKGGSKADL